MKKLMEFNQRLGMISKGCLFLMLMLTSEWLFAQSISVPKAFAVTAQSTATDITVNWRLSSKKGIRRVQLHRQSYDLPMDWSQRTPSQPSTVNLGVKLVNLEPDQTSYRDELVESGKRYYYRVVLLLDNKNKASEPSLPAIASLKDHIAPSAVVLETAKTINQETILLGWKASQSNDVEAYRIYRSRGESTPKVIKIINLDDVSKKRFEVTMRQKRNAQIAYDYSISAVDMAGNESALSNRITLRLPDSFAPQTPLQLTLKQIDKTIEINWLASREEDLAGYKIYRKKDGDAGEFLSIQTGLINSTQLTDSNIEPYTRYRYRVAAVDNDGNESKASRGLLIRTTGFDIAILAPQNLKVSQSKDRFPILKWQLNQPKGVKLAAVVIRRSDGVLFREISSIQPQISFTDMSVEIGRAYKYQVQALSANGELSPSSNTALWNGGDK